jgi:hypothetical protein
MPRIPSTRSADRGLRLVRASVVLGFAAAVGRQLAGGDDGTTKAFDASRDCGAPANAAFTAL